nr:MAG TPA: hypothetical protein [Caudoviricetes sp.]
MNCGSFLDISNSPKGITVIHEIIRPRWSY